MIHSNKSDLNSSDFGIAILVEINSVVIFYRLSLLLLGSGSDFLCRILVKSIFKNSAHHVLNALVEFSGIGRNASSDQTIIAKLS